MQKLFYERKTSSQNVAFIAIMSAINGIFALLSYFLPISQLLLILLIPLTSLIVVICVKKNYIPLYLIASILVCFLACGFDIFSTVLFVLPSTIIGVIYGLTYKIKIPTALSVFFTSLINLFLIYFSIGIINVVFDTNLAEIIFKIMGLNLTIEMKVILPSILLTYSLFEITISHFFILSVGESFGFKEINNEELESIYPYIIIGSIFLSIIFVFIRLSLSYLFLFIGFYFSIFETVDLIMNRRKVINILISISVFVALIIFITFNNYLPGLTGLLLLNIFSLVITLVSISIRIYTINKNKKGDIVK